jgi:hypothetical protein
MSDAVKRVSAEISGSVTSGSRDVQGDSALASGRASSNHLSRSRLARKRRHGARCVAPDPHPGSDGPGRVTQRHSGRRHSLAAGSRHGVPSTGRGSSGGHANRLVGALEEDDEHGGVVCRPGISRSRPAPGSLVPLMITDRQDRPLHCSQLKGRPRSSTTGMEATGNRSRAIPLGPACRWTQPTLIIYALSINIHSGDD